MTRTGNRFAPGFSRIDGGQLTAALANGYEFTRPCRPTANHPSIAHWLTVTDLWVVFVNTTVPTMG